MDNCIFCQNGGTDYNVIPCGDGNLNVNATYLNGSIMLFRDDTHAAGYFSINYCPICGRKIELEEDQSSPGVVEEFKYEQKIQTN